MKNAFLLIVVLLTGCVTTNFKSNSDFQTLRPFSRVLVVSTLPQVSSAYLDAWLVSFPTSYEVCVLDAGKLAFGKPDSLINEQIRECNAEVILTFELNRSYTTGNASGGQYGSGQIVSVNDLYLEMLSVADRKPFWKSIASTNSNVEIKPRRIIKQLVADAVIVGNVPPASY